MTSGQHVGAAQALKWGVVDKIAEGDLLKEAVAFCKSKVHTLLPRIF